MTIEGARAFHLSRYGEIDERQIELTCIRNGIAYEPPTRRVTLAEFRWRCEEKVEVEPDDRK